MRRFYIILLIFTLISQSIFANAGTPLMWLSMGQLVIGNIILGIIEGLIVAIIYKTKILRSILIMIAGNYASWIVGNGLLIIFQDYIIESVFKLNFVFTLWIISLFILYLLTIVIEMPFFRWTFNKERRTWKHSFKISVWINLITYTAMIMLYLSASKYTFFTNLKINQSLVENKTNFEIAYISKQKLYYKTLSDMNLGKELYKLEPIYWYHFNLEIDSLKRMYGLMLVNNKGQKLSISNISYNDRYYYSKTTARDWDKEFTADFRDSTKINWDVHYGFWAIEGLTITDKDKKKQNYAFEVPWMSWGIRKISIINDSEIICLFGNRIILLNKDSKEIAYISKGSDYIIKRK